MLVRIWRTKVHAERLAEYERFAAETSLPMFRAHRGFRGALMVGDGETRQVITLWGTRQDIAELESSPLYNETVDRIASKGFLYETQTAEVYEAHLCELRV
jgi:heme-degrading monooxygenase HmoA